jgi:hypothetical protein
MYNDELNVYSCDKYFIESNLMFLEKIWNIEELIAEYNQFISDLEEFFNEQLEGDDLKIFKGKTFELTDAKGFLHFPFTILDGRLKFMETDAWRSTILTSLVLKKLRPIADDTRQERNRKDENEHEYASKL